jgi:peptide-methionine (S)-S-oxide reductase
MTIYKIYFVSACIFFPFRANIFTGENLMKYILLVFTLLCANGLAMAQEQDTGSSYDTAIFAGGCFWCVEKDFEHVDGVVDVVSGYTGGESANPTYENHPGHYEAVKVTYNPRQVSYEDLLQVFWRNHDPFDARGQFCDKGSSYLAAIFPLDEAQQKAAVTSKEQMQQNFDQEIVTPVIDAKEFYLAEDYHQDYYKKNPIRYKFYRWNCGRDQRLEEIWKK